MSPLSARQYRLVATLEISQNIYQNLRKETGYEKDNKDNIDNYVCMDYCYSKRDGCINRHTSSSKPRILASTNVDWEITKNGIRL